MSSIIFNVMVVTEHETALLRGRIPTYLCLCFLQLHILLLEHSSRNNRDDLWLVNAGVGASFCNCFFIRRQSRRHQMQLLNQLLVTMYNHVCSYDMSCRPTVQHADPPIENLSAGELKTHSGCYIMSKK
jgi:hypothetical protein